jgi:hypothetical protein
MKANTGTGRAAAKTKTAARKSGARKPMAKAKKSATATTKAAAKKATTAKPPAKPSGKTKPKTAAKPQAGTSASRLIDARIAELGGWRGDALARMRALILEADPEVIEEVKWGGTPVWSRHGIVTTGEAYKQAVKLTFAKGAGLPDPARLFNSSLEGNTRRAIDIREGERVDAAAFKALVKAAIALNASTKKQ